MSTKCLVYTRSLRLTEILSYHSTISRRCHLSRYYSISTQTPPLPPKRRDKNRPFVHNYYSALFINTLDAARLTVSDHHLLPARPYLALSPRMYWPNPEEALSDNPTVPIKLKNPYELPYVSFLPYGASQGIDRVPFPNSQKGFFYYHTKPTPSPYSGQLRFRLTPVADPDSWASGSDLLLPNGLPWNKTVFAIATMHPKFTAIRNLMLADGLISSEMVTRCQEVLDWRRSLGPNHLLTDLGQPFVARFQSLDRGQFAIVGREEQKYVRVASFFRDMRNRLRSPYQGSAICQFELHVPKRTRVTRRFERLVHQSDRPPPRKIVLRVLKIVEPVSCIRDDYDGFVNEPKEGQLMTMGLGDARRPWSYNVDTGEVSHGSVGRSAWPQDDLSGLKLLFDYHPGTSCQ